GSSGIAVDPFGNVVPCVQWRRAAGNLHEQRIGEIWARSRGLADVRALTVAIKQRLSGEADASLFNFCPGLAESTAGDALAIYDGAHQRASVLREGAAERAARGPAGLRVIP